MRTPFIRKCLFFVAFICENRKVSKMLSSSKYGRAWSLGTDTVHLAPCLYSDFLLIQINVWFWEKKIFFVKVLVTDGICLLLESFSPIATFLSTLVSIERKSISPDFTLTDDSSSLRAWMKGFRKATNAIKWYLNFTKILFYIHKNVCHYC